ncbi:hypothetical protein ABZ897_59705 [Nonomuraea sp. NPDC046802]
MALGKILWQPQPGARRAFRLLTAASGIAYFAVVDDLLQTPPRSW